MLAASADVANTTELSGSPVELYLKGKVDEGVDDVVSQQVGLQAQLLQAGVLGIVVVLLSLHSGVGHRLHLHTLTSQLNVHAAESLMDAWLQYLPGILK